MFSYHCNLGCLVNNKVTKMTQDEEQLTESTPVVNENVQISELPARPFRLTMELPLFISMLSISLSGKFVFATQSYWRYIIIIFY